MTGNNLVMPMSTPDLPKQCIALKTQITKMRLGNGMPQTRCNFQRLPLLQAQINEGTKKNKKQCHST